jgi:DNA mismatch repair protein MutS2
VIPVTSAFKRKVQGIVHDESSTGKTSYIEPAEVVETNNQIRELELAERREIIRILTQLTDEFRPYLPDILNSCDFLGSLDFIRAKALLALKMNAVKPICFNRSSMRWVKAVHPLMFLAHSREGKEVVPLDIALDERQRIILISGPNAGGKSVCLKTLGLLQYMFQCGMLVPMSENSEIGIFHQIFMDIGDEQSIENDLSTYSSHLMNMKYFLRNADDRTLILIDEFGTGTEPALGGAIAESVLDHLNHKSVYGVVTTHYTNLKHFASSAEGIVNGAMLYDTRRMQPLFRLEIGMPGSSFAFEIARNIGLPEEILTQASERIGKDHIDFDKHLREIVRDKRYWESKREKIHQSEKKLEAELAKHTLELDRLEKDRKMILEQTRAEARELLSGVNRQIETTIREIRESQAEKEKTREVRKDLELLKEKIEQSPDKDEAVITARMEKIRARQGQIKKAVPSSATVKSVAPPSEKPLAVQDKVRIEGQEVAGEILEIQGKKASVAFGNLRMMVPLKKLQRVSQNEYKQYIQEVRTLSKSKVQVYDLRERRLQFKPSVDLRGQKTEDALRKVQELLDEALMLGFDEVKILHGKGNGILRQMIREFLGASGLVKSFADEQEEFGGAGITVVSL